MPFIGLEHFDAFGALSPCFTGAFWIWYTRPKGGDGLKSIFVSTDIGEQLLFSMFSSILSYIFELIFGSFRVFGA